MAFSADGRRLLTVANEEKIWIRKTRLFGLLDSGQVEDLPFTPARIWDVETGQQLAALPAGMYPVRCACFSPDGRKILTAEIGERNGAYYYDTGERFNDGPVFDPVFHKSPPTLARVYDASTGKELLKLPFGKSIYCAAFSPDGRRILTSCTVLQDRAQGICLWDAETGKLLFGLKAPGEPFEAWFSPDGRRIAVFSGSINPTEFRIHNAETGQELILFAASGVHAKNEDLRHTGFGPFSPDSKAVLAVVNDSPALFDVDTGQRRVVFRSPSQGVNSAVFSADGRFVVTALRDRTARVWDAATGKELFTLRHQHEVKFAMMTSDGRRVATAAWGHGPYLELGPALHRTPTQAARADLF
jgi:WD40 repeat protein